MSQHEAPRRLQERPRRVWGTLAQRRDDYSIEGPQGGITAASPTLGRSRPDVAGLQAFSNRKSASYGLAKSRRISARSRQDLSKISDFNKSKREKHFLPFTDRKLPKNNAWRLQNRGLDPPKSRPGASKIERGVLQDAIFKRCLT